MKRNSLFKMELLILTVLQKKDCYGYEIASAISKESEGLIECKEGIMYPILHRLLDEHLISCYEEVVNRKIRVYYHIEADGIVLQKELKKDFMRKFHCIGQMIGGLDDDC